MMPRMPARDHSGETPVPDDDDGSGFDATARALIGAMERTRVERWSESEFAAWALRAFTHQFMTCGVYRAWCTSRGITPSTIERWEDVPAVPATAFKYLDLRSPDDREPEVEFRTSGTTEGASRRGVHRVASTGLYRAASMGPLAAALLPDGERIPMVSLIPRPSAAPDSSLSFMVGAAADAYASEAYWLIDGDGSWNETEVGRFRDETAKEPVLLLGTALAFLHATEAGGRRISDLPDGSRIMETGGFKGVRRTISRSDLYRAMSSVTGVPPLRIVNEYGMTELLSQLWEPVLTEGESAVGHHRPAPWLRVRALHPDSLEPQPDGVAGVLAFFDVGNLGSVSHILTQDIGVVREGRLELMGRASDAEPRGCSRAMDDLMTTVSGHG